MSESPYLSIIVPAYNELENMRRGVLDQLLAYLNKQSYTWEIIISDDGSTDGSEKLLDAFAGANHSVTILHNVHAGKAPTVTSGMLKASGKWRLFTDFDQSTPISEVEKLLEFSATHEVIIGSREAEGALRDKEPFYRHLMGRGFNILVQLLAFRGLKDTQCGFKLFSATATERLFRSLYVYGSSKPRKDAFTGAFDVELLFLARKFGFPVKEVPISWKHYKSTRVSPVKDSLRMLYDILKIRAAYLIGKYR